MTYTNHKIQTRMVPIMKTEFFKSKLGFREATAQAETFALQNAELMVLVGTSSFFDLVDESYTVVIFYHI